MSDTGLLPSIQSNGLSIFTSESIHPISKLLGRGFNGLAQPPETFMKSNQAICTKQLLFGPELVDMLRADTFG